MPLTPRPPRDDAPIEVLWIGPGRGLGGRLEAKLVGDSFRVAMASDRATVLDRIEDDRVGPECLIVTDDAQDIEPLALARAVAARDDALPIVLCTTEETAYGPRDVLEAGVDTLLTEAELSDQRAVREAVRSAGETYRERVSNRQDASLLENMLSELPVHLFAKDEHGRHVRFSSALSDPDALLGDADHELWSGGDDDRHVIETGEPITNAEEYSSTEDRWYLVSKVPWQDDSETVGLAGLALDITDRKEREKQLRATTELLSTIVRTSPAAIVVHDDSGTVQFWNPAAEELFGWSAEEAIREPLPPYVGPDQREAFHAHVQNVIEAESIGPVEVTRRRRDGERLDLQESAAAIDPENGTPSRVVSVLTDVTELKARERRLRRQNERLESFAQVLAHDLRNPIQVVRGQLDRDGSAVDTDRLGRAVDRIESIAEDVLSIAREDPLVTDTETLSLASLARTTWENLKDHNGTLTIVTDCTFEGNNGDVRQLLEQLFENAIEHGGRDVTVTIGRLDDGFFVADDGRGIPDEDLDRPFEPGYSTDPNGTGFGLNLVREIAEAHGWEVELRDTDEGARFEIHGIETPQQTP